MRAFQSPFLLSSEGLGDDAVGEDRIVAPLLRSLGALGVTGLAVVPIGPRYLFSVRRPLTDPAAFRGARIRVNASPTTEDLLRALGARPTTAVPSGPATLQALRSGRLDAVEANVNTAVTAGYVTVARHVASPLFGRVTTLVANTRRLGRLGPEAARWIALAARRTAAARRAADERTAWAAACGAGVRSTPSSPAQLDALDAAALDLHSALDGDLEASLAIDRMGALAVGRPRVDPRTRCGDRGEDPSPTRELDGRYEMTASLADLERIGGTPGNEGPYRMEIGQGRYAIFHPGPPDPAWPDWDFDRDPVEVGSMVLRDGVVSVRPETAIRVGSLPSRFRFRLFRDRVLWRYLGGDVAAPMHLHASWRKVA
jgi:extracellular solute-binding protein (family 7)